MPDGRELLGAQAARIKTLEGDVRELVDTVHALAADLAAFKVRLDGLATKPEPAAEPLQ